MNRNTYIWGALWMESSPNTEPHKASVASAKRKQTMWQRPIHPVEGNMINGSPWHKSVIGLKCKLRPAREETAISFLLCDLSCSYGQLNL